MFFHFSGVEKHRPFVMVVDTTLPGSASNTFVLPLVVPSYKYNFIVEWGDGSREAQRNPTATTVTHVYSSPGVYKIKIHGAGFGRVFGKLGANGAQDAAKITSIPTLGDLIWTGNAFNSGFRSLVNLASFDASNAKVINLLNLNGLFSGCTSLNSVIDFDSSFVTGNLSNSFLNCSSFNSDVNLDTRSITAFDAMFSGCTSFKKDVSKFKIGSLVSAANMFLNADINDTGTTTRYDALLNSWAGQAYKTNVPFHAGLSKYSVAASAARATLVAAGWTITDGGLA